MPRTPLFIVLEGIDGSGTTTQIRALAPRLQPCVVTCEPTYDEIGLLIRDRMTRNADLSQGKKIALALLFAADRIEHIDDLIHPYLNCGHDVLSDRYVMSSFAYQSLDSPLKWIQMLNAHARDPDITFFVDVPVDLAQERILERAKKENTPVSIFDRLERQQRIFEQYHTVLATKGALTGGRKRSLVQLESMIEPDPSPIVIVDGRQRPEDLTEQLLSLIELRRDQKEATKR